MLINEVCKRCGLTKKAIEYYEEQGLTRPQIMENGYRVFSEDDVIQLNKIAVLRGLGISVSDIKTVLAENDYLSFQTICDKKELEISDIQAKQQLLHMLARNQNWEDARAQLSQLETKRSILSRLLDRFPGYFGKFISLHFALYLNERVATDEQQDAFETIIDFLDGVNIVIPDDLKEYLDDVAKTIDLVDVSKKAAASVAAAIQDPVPSSTVFGHSISCFAPYFNLHAARILADEEKTHARLSHILAKAAQVCLVLLRHLAYALRMVAQQPNLLGAFLKCNRLIRKGRIKLAQRQNFAPSIHRSHSRKRHVDPSHQHIGQFIRRYPLLHPLILLFLLHMAIIHPPPPFLQNPPVANGGHRARHSPVDEKSKTRYNTLKEMRCRDGQHDKTHALHVPEKTAVKDDAG